MTFFWSDLVSILCASLAFLKNTLQKSLPFLCSGTVELYYSLMAWLTFLMKSHLEVMISLIGGISLHLINGDKSVQIFFLLESVLVNYISLEKLSISSRFLHLFVQR